MKMTKVEEIRICKEKWEASGKKTKLQIRMYLTAEWQEAQQLDMEINELYEKAKDIEQKDELLAKAYKKLARQMCSRATKLQQKALKIAAKGLAE